MGTKFNIFALFYFVYSRANSKNKPPGELIRRGDLTEGFLRYDFGGLIFGGAYFRNFTVGLDWQNNNFTRASRVFVH